MGHLSVQRSIWSAIDRSGYRSDRSSIGSDSARVRLRINRLIIWPIARRIWYLTDRPSIGSDIVRIGRGTDLSLIGSVPDWICHLTLRRVARSRAQILRVWERRVVSTPIRPLFASIALYSPPLDLPTA